MLENDMMNTDAIEAFRRAGYLSVDLAADYLTQMHSRPVFHSMTPSERQELLEEPLSNEGMKAEDLIGYIREHIFTHPMGNGHARFFGWTPSTPHPMGAIADFLAAILNPNCVGGDHAATYLELTTIRWLMDLVAFPSERSMGLLVSGGSEATLISLAAARHYAALQDGWNDREEGIHHSRPPFVLYLSEEAHDCLSKAVELLGIGSQGVRVIPTDAQFRIDVDALRSAIHADRKEGKRPFCVIANAGTINTGAVDPLDAIADICLEEKLWFHVDGSLGAISILDPASAPLFSGMNRADSLTLDPHKALSVPFECGCVLVRDRSVLHDSFRTAPHCLYVEKGKGLSGPIWFSEYGVQLSRGFRALKLWMTLQAIGRHHLVERLIHYHKLARLLAQSIELATDFELMAPVPLSVVCFRYIPPTLQGQEEALEHFNRALVPLIQESGKAFVSSTVLRGHFALRACILHDTTKEEDILVLLQVIREAALAVPVLGTFERVSVR
jgi:aromatic-L-amino-acid/L-tryptophan decarboxylase